MTMRHLTSNSLGQWPHKLIRIRADKDPESLGLISDLGSKTTAHAIPGYFLSLVQNSSFHKVMSEPLSV